MNGGWGDWSDWTTCDELCGGGEQRRSRQCDSPEPKHGGKDCPGDAEEIRECNEDACESSNIEVKSCIVIAGVHGGWRDWADWAECFGSADCSDGEQTRQRWCNNTAPGPGGNDCVGSNIESRDCLTKCPGKLV